MAILRCYSGCAHTGARGTLAAHEGQLETLRWAHENDCPCNEETCSNAAANGHLHVLQWLHSVSCPWDVTTCEEAAWNGFLKVLEWARANDCPWNGPNCLDTAHRGQRPDVATWIESGAGDAPPRTKSAAPRGAYHI